MENGNRRCPSKVLTGTHTICVFINDIDSEIEHALNKLVDDTKLRCATDSSTSLTSLRSGPTQASLSATSPSARSRIWFGATLNNSTEWGSEMD